MGNPSLRLSGVLVYENLHRGAQWLVVRVLDLRLRGRIFKAYQRHCGGAQWLNGRVLDSRPKGRRIEPHRRHCVVVLEQDTFILA